MKESWGQCGDSLLGYGEWGASAAVCARSASAYSLGFTSPQWCNFCCVGLLLIKVLRISWDCFSPHLLPIFPPASSIFSYIVREIADMLRGWEGSSSLPGSGSPRAWHSPCSCCSNEAASLHLIIFCMVANTKIWHCLGLQAMAQQKRLSDLTTFSVNCFFLMEVMVTARYIPSALRSRTTKSISSASDAALVCLTLNQLSNGFSLMMQKLGDRGECWRS